MATTTKSTAVAVKTAFITAAKAEVPAGVTIHYAWPGPDATRRMVFFTDTAFDVDGEDAAIKAGRRFRNEVYDANFEIWCFPDDGPADPAAAETDANAIFDACAEAVVKAGSAVQTVAGVRSVECGKASTQPVTVEKEWAIVITARLRVTARLS